MQAGGEHSPALELLRDRLRPLAVGTVMAISQFAFRRHVQSLAVYGILKK